MRRLLPTLLPLLAASAYAQPKPEELIITMADDLEYVGRDNCESELARDRTITVQLENPGNFQDYELRLSATTTSEETCSRDDLLSCPAAEGACRCLDAADDADHVSFSGSIAEAFDTSAEELCAFSEDDVDAVDGLIKRLRFYSHYTTVDANNAEEDAVKGEPKVIVIDFEPPVSPREAPTVTSSENALRVEIGEVEVDASEVDYYEVCVKVSAEEQIASSDAGSSEKCVDVPADGEVKVKNLENGVTYDVWYRAIDLAGNVGESSPVAQGIPEEQLDFAEIYRARGGLETGGCSSSGAGGAWLLGFLLLTGIAIRRQG